ncbi:MAG: kelch repeat-containing protein [Ferruginibacter sp.]
MKKIICCITFMTLMGVTKINAQDTWAKENPATEPSTRTFNRLAQIGPDKILMFGGANPYGLDPYSMNDTWIYTISTKTWMEMLPPTMPTGHILTPRGNFGLAYIGDDKVLLYGGDSYTEVVIGGTWIFDLSDNTWTEMATSTSPGLRYLSSMAYIGNNEVVLFGGSTSFIEPNSTNDTWVYNYVTNTWTEKFPATVPGKRILHAMCNIGGDKVMMNDGTRSDLSGNFIYDETWVYDGSENNWELKNPVGGPGAHQRHGLASLGGDKALWFEGTSWIYDLSENSWTYSAATTAYTFWGEPGLASAGTNKVLAFGGTPRPSETWLFTSGCSITVSAGADEHLLFGYPPAQCKTKTAVVTGGAAPFTYNWTLDRALLTGETMTGANTASVTICLMDTTELCVMVTDAGSCTASDCATIFAEDVRCFAGNNQKTTICHNGNTICVDNSAVPAHLAHGDHVGPCTVGFAEIETKEPEDKNIKQGFSVSPNPGNGSINIIIDQTENANRMIRIIDMNGVVVKQIEARLQRQFSIAVKPGMYQVEVFSDKLLVEKKKVVVF